MEIKPIRNEDDYKNTLKEIELLWESPIDTPDGDRLDVLVTLVEAYETEHYPIPAIDDPVGVLEYYLVRRLHEGLNIPADLLIGKSRKGGNKIGV